MKTIINLVRKELRGYFNTPIGYVFISVYILLSMSLVMYVTNFFDANQASLNAYFTFQPWVFLFLIPAIGMRLWSEEKNAGTIEFLLTLPITTTQAVLGKFLAGWIFATIAVACTFPFLLTVAYLGDPDSGPIIGGYFGTILLAGGYLSITCLMSALTRNQVISFILSTIVNFLILLIGWGVLSGALNGILGTALADTLATFSYSARFTSLSKGVLSSQDIVYFLSLIGVALALNVKVLDRFAK